MFCDNCAAESAHFDHLDVSGPEPVFKRLCKDCGDVEKARWDAEKAPQSDRPAA